ncbi:MAG: response regulator [Defluviitaleaceae bacterium]|nr:response regulator [Defluviitaleaceae bacterium]MCL2835881.1 response regulator [Defluviitaleaceae bacterium]
MGKSGTILVVDDVDTNRIILEAILDEDFDTVHAADGEEALEVIFRRGVKPDLILLDIMMPNINGYELLAILRTEPDTADIPVIFITAEDDGRAELVGLSAGAVDYITKPFIEDVVKRRVENYMELLIYRKSLEEMVTAKVTELTAAKDHMIESMATIIEYRNLESGLHVKRTTALAGLMVNQIIKYPRYKKALKDMDYEVMVKAAPLHDVGKIAVPDEILLKPGRYEPWEFEIMKGHSAKGGEIIEAMMEFNKDKYFQHCYDIAKYHHERWDGSGYPDKLSGEDIPLSARIISIVDVYDALITKRVYKPAFPHGKAIDIMKEGAGTQFDPHLIDILLEIEGDFRDIAEKLKDPD